MGLVKRGNVWWMSFTYEGRQIRRSTETSDKRLAEAILGKVRVEIVEGKYFDKPREDAKTFSELMDRYLWEHASRRMHYRRYVNMVENLKAFFGDPKLHHMTPKTIVAFKNKRYADGVTPATINRELAVLKKAFNLACREWEWARDNPVCRVSMEREQNTRDRWLTEEEEARLLAVASSWVRELVIFAANTGMRRGEILSLTWKGVDFARRTVTVFRSKNGGLSRSIRPSWRSSLSGMKRERTASHLGRVSYSRARPILPWMGATSGEHSTLLSRQLRLRISTSMICGIPLRRGLSRQEWISTKSNDCSDTSRRT